MTTNVYDWSEDQEVVTEPEAVTTDRRVDSPDQDRPPVYATVTGRQATDRRPVLPAWVRSRADATAAARFAAGNLAHTTLYHTTRTPKYALRVALWAPVGMARVLWRLLRWVADPDGRVARDDEARRVNPTGQLHLMQAHDSHIRHRLVGLAVGLLLLTGGAVALWALTPGWVPWAVVGLLLLVLARVGRPADKPLTDTAVVIPRYRKLTAESVRRALCSLGIAAMKQPESITFPAEISRSGPGYLATVDLPHGVTVCDVVDRRSRLASALRVSLDTCWPEPVAGQHEGRLALWVADEPVSQMRQPAWPLARHGTVDVFRSFPFGTDPRKRPVTAGLMWRNWLIGALPGAGKTGAMRLLLLAASLDPRVELRGFELKGTGDLDMLESVCSQYGSGPDDDTVEAALGMLRWARQECNRRARLLKAAAAAGKAPENRLTPALAGTPELRPLVLFVDECQELFGHDQFGTEAGQLATAVIKLGRALGVVLLLATQRPDKQSLPTGVSANVNTRLCLRVAGQVENDLILGTSAYRNGLRSTQWTDRDLGWGWLAGVGDPVACHVYWLDVPAARRVAARAAALRGGVVGGDQEQPVTVRRDPAADALRVWTHLGNRPGVHWGPLAELLAEHQPEAYTGITADALSALLRGVGVPSVDVKVEGSVRKGCRLAEIQAAAQRRAIEPATGREAG